MNDIRQTPLWGKHLADIGWKTISVPTADKKHQIKVYLMKLVGWPFTMMKIQRSTFDPDFTELKKLKRKYWVVSSIIEPLVVQDPSAYKKAGYRLTRFPYLATKTYIVDLTKTKEELWKALSENARRMIKKNKKVTIEEISPEDFFPLWKKSSKVWTMKQKELINMKRYFGDKARLIVSNNNGEYHSGLLLLYTNDMANYYQTWTSLEGRDSGAHYKLVWEEMLRAKKNGLKFFDFEGVFDERWPQKRWLGFTEFKRRFGGDLVSFPGCFFRWL